ncbi:hypothetical protein Dsin_005870 [Dipteronia sinensis]|uniref:Reverse transcriptase domain-containing protein n=1 Tax=Dipteronia sinensis TaxID=43782 RepID=A0AAE0AY42_9ROSI|nr:hypothetical protein Dsin_005870 [Dipteronia sinensis]
MPARHGIGSTLSNIIDKVISNDQVDFMGRDVTNDEIREVCFSLHPNKAPSWLFPSKEGPSPRGSHVPYLFVIAMEVLSKILAKHIENSCSFKFHWKCDKIELSHLCFEDDLIMLCHGSHSSAFVLNAMLDEFSMYRVSMLFMLRATSSLPVYAPPLAISLSTSLVIRLVLYPLVI